MSPRFSRPGALLAVCVIAACVVFVVRKQSENRMGGGAEVHPNRMLELMARYVVGVRGLMGGDNALGEWQSNLDEKLMENVVKVSRGKADELRVLIVEGCVTHAWPAKEKFDALAAKDADLQADVGTLERMKGMNGAVQEEAWAKFRKRHGWIAELARAQTGNDEAKRAVAQQGMKTAVALIGFSLLGMCAAVGGLVVLILGISHWRSRKICLTLAPRSRVEGGALLEGFAIFLVLFLFPPWPGTQCLADGQHSAGYFHDPPGPRFVLRRPRPQEERSLRHCPVHGHRRSGNHPVVGLWLQPFLRCGQCLHRRSFHEDAQRRVSLRLGGWLPLDL
jgi:hypothetical protein